VIPLPIRDENPTEKTPVVTIAIIVINVGIWIWQFLQPVYQVANVGYIDGVQRTVLDYGAIPNFVLHNLHSARIPMVINGIGYMVPWKQELPQAWMTVFSSMFMHGGWMHIIGNMWFLWIFGDNIEDSMGSVRFVFFYLICGIAAAAAQILASPNSLAPMVGASGAIAGVLGGYLLLFPHARIKSLLFLFIIFFMVRIPAWVLLGLWFVSQFAVTKGSGIAWMAHVGGFLAGLGLIRLFVKSRPVRPRRIAPGTYDLG
jgi:membrane associated rhomboid family serine protease